MDILDCREHKCPHPVVETRKKILSDPGSPLTVLVGDEISRQNVTRLAISQGYGVEVSDTEGGFALNLSPARESTSSETTDSLIRGKTVVFLGSDVMGSGNDELGRLLMKNYLFTLAELDPAPDILFFVNTGVHLTTEGSEVLEGLDQLACMGTDIASCGLCLDFFNLKEKLAVGRTTNMLEIAESLNSAGRVIRP